MNHQAKENCMFIQVSSQTAPNRVYESWNEVNAQYKVGDCVVGMVAKHTHYGVFIILNPAQAMANPQKAIQGFVHYKNISISEYKREEYRQFIRRYSLNEGETLETMIAREKFKNLNLAYVTVKSLRQAPLGKCYIDLSYHIE
ncbi:MAG: hypothetical protein K0S74_1750 [Chlamydiales bacterium]|jgi:ribosomal protein S1|nr:hypothetical protein [Chlamydiales bacterium]